MTTITKQVIIFLVIHFYSNFQKYWFTIQTDYIGLKCTGDFLNLYDPNLFKHWGKNLTWRRDDLIKIILLVQEN